MRSAGVSEETISDVVEAALPKEQDLITLEEAAEQHGIPYGTLTRWIHVGHLNVIDRIRFPARGGGKVLVDNNDVMYLSRHRPKKGRPSKNGQLRE